MFKIFLSFYIILGVYKRYFTAYRKDVIRAMWTNSVENTESIYGYTLSTMYRGVKISGLNCKKLRFRSYFQPLPSRVCRRTVQHIANNAICARQTSIKVGFLYHFKIHSECRPPNRISGIELLNEIRAQGTRSDCNRIAKYMQIYSRENPLRLHNYFARSHNRRRKSRRSLYRTGI